MTPRWALRGRTDPESGLGRGGAADGARSGRGREACSVGREAAARGRSQTRRGGRGGRSGGTARRTGRGRSLGPRSRGKGKKGKGRGGVVLSGIVRGGDASVVAPKGSIALASSSPPLERDVAWRTAIRFDIESDPAPVRRAPPARRRHHPPPASVPAVCLASRRPVPPLRNAAVPALPDSDQSHRVSSIPCITGLRERDPGLGRGGARLRRAHPDGLLVAAARDRRRGAS